MTSFATQLDPSQNFAGVTGSTAARYLGFDGRWPTINEYITGNLADVQFIEGQALSGSALGQLVNGVWQPTAYTGGYGTNGYHLTFASGAIGTDVSGNGGTFTPVNLSNANVSSLSPGGSGSAVTPTMGNMVLVGGSGNDTLQGGAGNDLFEGNGGNDTIDGGGGTNTALFRGTSSQYTIALNPTTGVATVTDTVAGRDGTQTLTNIQN